MSETYPKLCVESGAGSRPLEGSRTHRATGRAERFEGGVLYARLDRAFAPGTPARLELGLPDGPLSVDAKAMTSRRVSEDRFAVRWKLINVRRGERARLDACFGAQRSGGARSGEERGTR